jgi:hypothetical protein
MKERSKAEQTLFRFSYTVGLLRGGEKIRDGRLGLRRPKASIIPSEMRKIMQLFPVGLRFLSKLSATIALAGGKRIAVLAILLAGFTQTTVMAEITFNGISSTTSTQWMPGPRIFMGYDPVTGAAIYKETAPYAVTTGANIYACCFRSCGLPNQCKLSDFSPGQNLSGLRDACVAADAAATRTCSAGPSCVGSLFGSTVSCTVNRVAHAALFGGLLPKLGGACLCGGVLGTIVWMPPNLRKARRFGARGVNR